MGPPYSTRPEWADVAPVWYDDGNKVVAIQYSPEHADALAYFRAILQSDELSERALQLTEDMIGFNQADFTAWNHRWRCVKALGPECLERELDFTNRIMQENAKNYQLWNHRRKCALERGTAHAESELAFVGTALNFDEKNYHAWAHRQVIVKMSGRWEAELEYCDEMITRDVRNNSAWNHRMFVQQHWRPDGDPAAWMRSELEYVATQIQKAPRNESAWTYLAGLFCQLEPWRSQQHALSRWPEVFTICCEALRDCPSCSPALDTAAQYYEGLAALNVAKALASMAAETRSGAAEEAYRACDAAQAMLDEAAVADPMRMLYWQHRKAAISKLEAALYVDVDAESGDTIGSAARHNAPPEVHVA